MKNLGEDISHLGGTYKSSKQQKALNRAIDNSNIKSIHLNGVVGSSIALTLSAIPYNDKTFVIVANDAEEGGYLYHDLTQICGKEDILFFPSSYKRAAKYGQIDTANGILRTETLNHLNQSKKGCIIVTYPDCLAEKVVAETELTNSTINIKVGDKITITNICNNLFELGFELVEYVYEPGQYSVRGGIIDIFSFAGSYPFRVDMFDNEVDSIRTFNIESQLSIEHIKEINIIPNVSSNSADGIRFTEFVAPNTIFAFANLQWAMERIKSITSQSISSQLVISNEGDMDVAKRFVNADIFANEIENFKRIDYGQHSFSQSYTPIEFNLSPLQPFSRNFDNVGEIFSNYYQQGYTIYLLSDSYKQSERLSHILTERDIEAPFTYINKTLHTGFVDNEQMVAILPDHQIFNRFHKYRLSNDNVRSGKIALSLKEIKSIQIGDYVVHIDHGVGRFGGLVRSDINGHMQELVKLTYKDGDTIFVSIHALHKLSKYRGKDGTEPKIYKLGGGAWQKLKDKTKSKVKEIARDLILLYAKRGSEKGFQFSADTFLQEELEASFMYEDTPDQVKTMASIKVDMERDIPMDRLVCGDVGFGKTEIAVRAAFKAACDNMQSVVLVPTTVLAYQHYNTFSNRLKNFPVKVDYLSRARTAKETKQILANLADGKLDIVIGTHKVIGKSVSFKSLGLLIIDEEQKFGVSVKERLKQIKSNVDTLTMSATPIPRTLQFSLLGARDMSMLTTPPPNRQPIQTEVHPFDEEIIKDAIEFELSRNGQVFIVNNRIAGLNTLAATINKLIPDARIVIGHGQMKPDELEKIIMDFTNYEYDILLATTIIESGIDMPNTNTIIINDAQNFGLSDLHQLRGRVGRSNKKGFCYLFTPPYRELTQESRRRLQAIENFSELGSGIHIAMQDLDIRGAGNMLGAEQSGFITDLGYETYQKILKEAVTELKTDEFNDLFSHENQSDQYVTECVISTDLELLFPATYISNNSERIMLYQELDNMTSSSEIPPFIERVKDRFGKLPKESLELIRVVELREIAKELGIEKVMLKGGKMNLYFISNEESDYFQSDAFGKLITYVQQEIRRAEFRENRGKKILTISKVQSISKAIDILKCILGL